MAEFNCYECGKILKTGEKFTFTKKGAVHFDCFTSAKRSEVSDDKLEKLRTLSILLDSELKHLLDILELKNTDQSGSEEIKAKYKEIERACGETTKMITEL